VLGQSGDDDADTTEAAGDEQSLAHKRGLRRSDEVVQQLTVAKYALTIGDTPRAMAAIDAALGTARRSLSDLLDLLNPPQRRQAGDRFAGTMVRETAAGTERPRMQAASHLPPSYERTRTPQP
jgi:hypothetical protein